MPLTNPRVFMHAQKAAEGEQLCFLYADGVGLVFLTKIIAINSTISLLSLKNTIPYTRLTEVLACTSFHLQCGKASFYAQELQSNGLDLLFSIIRYEVILEEAATFQKSIASALHVPDEGYKKGWQSDWHGRFLHPLDGKTWLRKPLLTWHQEGCKVLVEVERPLKLWEPGRVFPQIEVWHERCMFYTQGVVSAKHYLYDMEGEPFWLLNVAFSN